MSETRPHAEHPKAAPWLARLRRFFPWMLCATLLVGAFRLRIDTEVLNVLPAGNEAARGLSEHQKNFLDADELLVVVRSADPEATGAAARAIHAAATNAPGLVKRAYWQPPANESIESLGQFLAHLWLNGPTGTVQSLAERLAPANLGATLTETKNAIATTLNPSDMLVLPRDPLGLSRIPGAGEQMQSSDRFFASEDGLTRLVYLYAAEPLKDYDDCRRWVGQIRELARQATSSVGGNATFGLTGRPVFVDEISSGMKNDLSTAVPGTLLTIAVLFFLLHREIRSLALLLGTLLVVLGCTALAGAAVLGELNVLSIGFASILLGLAEDFGIVLHHESKLHPGASASEIRRIAGPGILGSALTTAAAFALLNISSLPGLRSLGTLVAIGIGLGAWAMLWIFLPLIVRWKSPPPAGPPARVRKGLPVRPALGISAALLAASAIVALVRTPDFESSPDVLRPRRSEASATLQIVQEMIGAGDPYWMIVKGSSIAEVRGSLEMLDAHLAATAPNLGINEYSLPLDVWPQAENQRANLAVLKTIASANEPIERQILAEGFTEEALALTRAVWREWQQAESSGTNWPRGELAEWILPKVAKPSPPMALGIVRPSPGFDAGNVVPGPLKDRVTLTGWGLLGKTVLADVRREIPVIVALVAVTVAVALWLTFRSVPHVLACLATLLFGGLILIAVMGLAGLKWNLINITGVPLLLGMGIDYSIHILAAFDRSGRDARATFASVGSALLLAGSTSIAGFFFLALSSNAGMASLGAVCALGLAILLLTSVFLLPAWAAILLRAKSSK